MERTNTKNMLVTLEFTVNSIDYKIERGRKPNVLRFYINNVKQETDEDSAQGENKSTQEAIEKILNFTPTMFKHIVALNTYSEPFLALKTNEQREIIEQLLGITLLSEKAEVVKELIRQSKDSIQAEEFKLKAIEEANKRVKEQIDSLKRRQTLWTTKHDQDLLNLAIEYNDLIKINIEGELQAHKDLIVYNTQKQQQDSYNTLVARSIAWKQKQDKDIDELQSIYNKLSHIDIAVELQAHTDLATYIQKAKDIAEFEKLIARCVTDEAKEQKTIDKLQAEIEELKNHKCYACGQDFHDANHETVLATKKKALQEAALQALSTNGQWLENIDALKELGELGTKPTTHYRTETEAIRHSSELENIQHKIDAKRAETDPYAEQLAEHTLVEVGVQPVTHYDTEAQAVDHRSRMNTLVTQIATKGEEKDPYTEQITEMQQQALQTVSYDTLNDLTRLQEHQDFLLKLLTSKDSFVRKKIIDQNLSYLNARLTHYLDRIGLPHTVKFQNDLTVSIEELGRELDFDNLSRGERNRLILSMSWAFRDVWESLYSPINLLFIDELIDNGLDTQGVENALALLKKMSRERHKSIWLVSHRDELAGRVENILKVIKENGFTSYNTDIEIA
jgi:DNA repair exonuclease SbcCD ATPase subunit